MFIWKKSVFSFLVVFSLILTACFKSDSLSGEALKNAEMDLRTYINNTLAQSAYNYDFDLTSDIVVKQEGVVQKLNLALNLLLGIKLSDEITRWRDVVLDLNLNMKVDDESQNLIGSLKFLNQNLYLSVSEINTPYFDTSFIAPFLNKWVFMKLESEKVNSSVENFLKDSNLDEIKSQYDLADKYFIKDIKIREKVRFEGKQHKEYSVEYDMDEIIKLYFDNLDEVNLHDSLGVNADQEMIMENLKVFDLKVKFLISEEGLISLGEAVLNLNLVDQTNNDEFNGEVKFKINFKENDEQMFVEPADAMDLSSLFLF